MKPLKQLKRLFLLLCLIVAGVQSAWADNVDHYVYLQTKEVNGFTYYLYKYSYSFKDSYGNWKSYEPYYRVASLCGISGSGDVEVPSSFNDGVIYHVKFIGYWPDQQQSEDLTFNNVTRITLGGTQIYGHCSMPQLATLYSNGGFYWYEPVEIYGTLNAPNLASILGRGGISVSGTLKSDALTYLDCRLKISGAGKLDCPNLRTLDFKESMPDFPYSAYYSDIFTAPVKTITAHVYDKTPNEINELRNNNVWKGFKEIINHKTSGNFTLTTDGKADISFLQLNDNATYVSSYDKTQKGIARTGSSSGTFTIGGNYAIEIKGVDPTTQIVKLKRNGYPVELGQTTDQGVDVYYYDETNLQEDVNYEVSVEYETCDVSFTQENYRGNISYSRRLNGETTTGAIYSTQASMTWPRGAQITLSIPYDQYTPQTLKVDGVEKTLSCSNGVATATFYVPSNKSTSQVLLTWAEPQVSFAHHQPQIMIMRSGEGNVLFKGLCQPEEQAAEAYEQQFGYPEENGIVVSAVADCQNTVTTVTVPDYDYLGRGEGYEFDATEWGMQTEITPVAGQTLKTLLVGWLKEEDGRKAIEWEDILHGAFSNYVQYNEGTNTYTFNWGFDEMNVWIGDYIINIVMGPEESAVETGKTLNFVRKGGRGHAWIYWHDTDYDYYFNEDGSSTKVIPNEQLTDLQMTVQLNEGESMHVYKDGVDITGQFQQRESSDEYWAELEEESASYTLLIEESPDANPTWTVLQSGEMTGTQVVITRNGEDETTTIGAATTMTIDDVGVEKVTLKVPVGHLDPVVQYKVMLDAVENENTVRIYLINTLGLGRFAVTDLFNSLPALIPIDAFDTEEEAQAIVEALANKGGTAHTESGNYGATQTIADNVPIKVVRNGEDMTFQMTYGDPLYAIYEVPADVLTNATWEVSFDISHKQTIYRKGGTGEVEMAYGYLSNDYNVPLDNGFTTIDLPAFNYDAGNRYVEFSIEYVEGENVKVYRNGVDVTSAFGEPQTFNGKQYYYISDESTPNTQNTLGFILREAATWEVVIETDRPQNIKTNTIINNDEIPITYVSTRKDGLVIPDNNKTYKVYQINMDDNDRQNVYASAQMKIPVHQTRQIRVLCNDVDITNTTPVDGYYVYTFNLSNNDVYQVSYTDTQYDIDRNGSVNITDVTKLVNKILGRE